MKKYSILALTILFAITTSSFLYAQEDIAVEKTPTIKEVNKEPATESKPIPVKVPPPMGNVVITIQYSNISMEHILPLKAAADKVFPGADVRILITPVE